MEINRREIYRYLGYGRQAAGMERAGEEPDQVQQLVEECIAELERAATPRSVSRVYPLTVSGDGVIDGVCFRTASRGLRYNLKDCDEVLVFAATLGTGVDHLIQRYNKLQVSKAVVLQAASASMIESYCDQLNKEWKQEYLDRGLYLRPRFSPGYGDFELSCQKTITAALETGKRIGLTLTDSCLMAPSKSVTAVIGISRVPKDCTIQGCEACGKKDCAYKRDRQEEDR